MKWQLTGLDTGYFAPVDLNHLLLGTRPAPAKSDVSGVVPSTLQLPRRF
jgi:hypothetical protein